MFFWGFRRLREKRDIESVPVSKTRSAALGPVELQGRARPKFELYAPFSHSPCVYYKYVVEEFVQRGKSSSWETIARGDSSAYEFWIEDETGKALVRPKGAESSLPVNNEYSNTLFSGNKIPDEAIQFLASQGHSVHTWLGLTKTLRFKESFIGPGEPVFALGVATELTEEHLREREREIAARAQKIKHNPTQMATLGVVAGGQLRPEMWDHVRDDIAREVDTELRSEPNWVLTGGGDNYFVISNRSAREVVSRMGWEAFGLISAGMVMGSFGTVFTASLLGHR
jgi:hypothetical protein